MNNFQLFTTSKIKILYLLCRGVVQQAQRFCVMRAVWFIDKFELLLDCTKHPNYSPKSRTPQ